MKNRALMKAEQAQKKALKMAAAEAYRSKKPGECLKVSGYFTFKSVLTLMLQWFATHFSTFITPASLEIFFVIV